MKPEGQNIPNINPQNHMNPSLNIPAQFNSQMRDNKEFYMNSVLKMNSLQQLCRELSSTEMLENNVEKFGVM